MESAMKGVSQPELARHDSSVLDLAFAMDCTGSMGSYIHNAQQNIRKIVEEIVSGEQSDIRLALVQYRDHPPQESTFVTDTLDLTSSVARLKTKLDGCSANGGGDAPEAVADALQQVVKLSWREEATKICVLISDAPPHGLAKAGDNFPNGCPAGLDPVMITREMATKGITLYAVGCEPSIIPYKEFFSALAHMTGGQYVPLGNAQLLAKVIIGGAQEEITLERLMAEVDEEVRQEAHASGGCVVKVVLSERIHKKMMDRGVKSKNLRRNDAELPEASGMAQAYAEMSSLTDVAKAFTPAASSGASMSPFAGGMGGGAPLGMGRGAPLGMSLGAPSGMDGGAPPPTTDVVPECYSMVEDFTSAGQVNRMVTKSMARNFIPSKKS